MILNYTPIYHTFETFVQDRESYIGSLYISIYHDLPICYSCYYDENKKFCHTLRLNKNKIKNSEYSIQKPETIKNFISGDIFETFQYTPFEYLILGKDFPMLINISTNGDDDSFNPFENVYLPSTYSEEDVERVFNILSKYFCHGKKEAKVEFGIAAVDSYNNLYTHYYDFNKVNIDIKENYNDDLPYDQIINILNKEASSLMLFYGEPGTGKSTLIKKFISEMPDKEFIFMDGTLLANIQQDKLMAFFMENQKAIFIFEDCEKILLTREKDYNPTMSILLNLTDGIISDVLNIKIICTFNTSLNNIDKALLRKGRLSLKYEFKKLDKEKVNKILNIETNKEMSLADIYHYLDENDYSQKKTSQIGFTI